VSVRVVPAAALAPGELARWAELRRANPVYRSPFFTPEFTLAVGAVRDVRVAVIEDAGTVAGFLPFEAGRRRHGRPVGRPFSDYHGVVADEGAAIDPRDVVRACGLATWSFDHLPAAMKGFGPYVFGGGRSPCLDLSHGFEPYLDARRARSDIRGALRKARKLDREVGPLRLVPDCDDAELLARTVEWKRLQYAETGVRDVLADPWGRELLARLHATRGPELSGVLSVLYAGDVVAGLHLGLRSRHVWHSWFPAYNPELHRYSPGLVHLLELARTGPELGITEIDLGKGEARYKQALATDAVALCEGCVSAHALAALSARARTSTRRAVRAVGLHRAIRRLRR
jgi:CelD/BcsL family acetyltransferase involved in cellulose biosynthesis